jgi:hypothetical protein
MQLFKTEMLRFHPPQPRTYGAGLRSRRLRFGCRTAPRPPSVRVLAAAVHSALVSPSPALPSLDGDGDLIGHPGDGDHAAEAA